jgi:hypothetical protein
VAQWSVHLPVGKPPPEVVGSNPSSGGEIDGRAWFIPHTDNETGNNKITTFNLIMITTYKYDSDCMVTHQSHRNAMKKCRVLM